MAPSPYLLAKRAFVSVILAVRSAYHMATTVNRDPHDKDLLRICRRLLLKVHPDKGGKRVDMHRLQETQCISRAQTRHKEKQTKTDRDEQRHRDRQKQRQTQTETDSERDRDGAQRVIHHTAWGPHSEIPLRCDNSSLRKKKINENPFPHRKR